MYSQLDVMKDAGIAIYAVGVGDKIKEDELKKMASDEFYYTVRNYDSISKIKKSLLSRICKTTSTDKECHHASIDLQFVVDASQSVGQDNFEHAKNFVKSVTNVFDLRTGAVRVGVITYHTIVDSNAAVLLGATNSLDAFNVETPFFIGCTHKFWYFFSITYIHFVAQETRII